MRAMATAPPIAPPAMAPTGVGCGGVGVGAVEELEEEILLLEEEGEEGRNDTNTGGAVLR